MVPRKPINPIESIRPIRNRPVGAVALLSVLAGAVHFLLDAALFLEVLSQTGVYINSLFNNMSTLIYRTMERKLVLILVALFTLSVRAEVVVINGVTYNLISKGNIAEVVESRDSITTAIEVWDEEGDSIKLDSAKVWKSYSGDVVIPETVTYDEVIYTVTTIREKAFANCALNSITIPSSITKICKEAFSYGSASSVKINDLAAWCNINFESYFYTNPLSKASHLFLNDEEIHDLVIPDGVKTITNNAFYQFQGLTSVKIPSSVTSIGYECFYGCSGIKTIEIGDSTSQEATTVLGGRTFYMCNNVDSVALGNNIVEIGREAFYKCKGIRSIVIPNSVKTMGSHVFLGCENLESVQLSENLKSIEWSSFNGCTSLKEIVIPDGVEHLGDDAFYGCTNLTSVKLPNNLKKIDWSVFSGCTSLTSIEIPDLTHTIYISAFNGCSNLKTVILGKSVQDIQNEAFAYCPALEDIYCKAKTPPTCHTTVYSGGWKMDSFYDSYIEYITLHVPANSVETYKTTEPWSQFKTVVPIIMPEHTLTYMVDGEVYKTYSIEVDEAIILEPEPTKEGFAFSGWSEIPETMPAYDVTVTGSFVASQKCATPSIMYENGVLRFGCETESVTFVPSVKIVSENQGNLSGDKLSLDIVSTCTISVYATREGYEKSETATKTITLSNCVAGENPSVSDITRMIERYLNR